MKEIWKDISGYDGLYQVRNLGNVKSLNYNHTGKPKNLSIKKHHTGYRMVTLCRNKTHKNLNIHFLVAHAFIENHDNKPCVNHIDGNKANNCVSNLEWVSYSENTRHAIRTGLRADSNMIGRKGRLNPLSRPIYQYTKSSQLVKKWLSISDAARNLNCSPSSIINNAKGRTKSLRGYIWKYEED